MDDLDFSHIMRKQIKKIFATFCIGYGVVAIASIPILDDVKDVRFDFALGPSWFHASSADITVSAFETDRAVVTTTPMWPTYRLGVGYFFEKVGPSEYLMDILLQLNWYNSQTNIEGNVWQYQEPIFNNFTFQAPLTNNRLMFDIKPTLFSFEGFSFYPIVGLGVSWSTLSYRERISQPGIPSDSFISLKSQTNTTFSYDLGVGVGHHFTPHFGVSVEYLYNNMNNLSPSIASNAVYSQVTILSPPRFGVSNQNVLFGINWLI